MNIQRRLWIAGAAAVAATACDFLLLSVMDTPGFGLGIPDRFVLIGSGLLGAILIPSYALGYAGIAGLFESESQGPGRMIRLSGIVVGVGGGILHGATAVVMLEGLATGAVWQDPVRGVLGSGFLLPMLWVGVVAAALCAAGALLYGAFTGRCRLPLVVVALNPALLTVLIGVVAVVIGSETLALVVAPAAPNLSHAVFFFAAGSAMGRNGI